MAVKHAFFRKSAALALLLALALAALTPAALADGSPDPTRLGHGYSAILYDNSNGLPTSEANAIVQSSDGYIWIGSYSGLIRYDGNNFYRYDASSGVSSVVTIFADSHDRVWIGTNDSGVACLRDEQFTFYSRADGLASTSIRSIAEDSEGNILIATTMGLAYVEPDGSLHTLSDAMINKQYICELIAGPEGVVYGVTNGGDIFTVEQKRVSGYYSADALGFGPVNTLYPDPEKPGWIYLGTLESTVAYGDLTRKMQGAETMSAAPQSNINAIRLVDGQVWICADNGIGRFDAAGRYAAISDLPMTNSVDHMISDYEQNLWFSSSRQGVMKIVDNRFMDISAAAKLDSMVVNATCRDGGRLYIGTDTGLVLLDSNSLAPVENELTEAMEGVRIRCIKRSRDGLLWLCTYSNSGLVSYDPRSGAIQSYNMDDGLASNRIRMLTELDDGTLAVATNAGLNLMRGGAVTATYDGSSGISNLEILCAEEGPDGRIFLGSDGDGIYVVDGSRVSRLGIEDGLRSEVILRLKKDPQEELYWIVTSNSISYLRDGEITTLRNFPYANNFDLFFDANGRIWILSSDGIYVVRREDMLADTPTRYTKYDTRSGLTRVTTANSYSWLEEDGTLYIACSTGVCSVNIDGDAENNSEVRLAVPYITADDRYISLRGRSEVHIPSDCRRLNIYASAFTYALYNPRIAYYLEGFDTNPIETTKQDLEYASYTNLSGGTYLFHMDLINTLTGETDQTLTVTIIKDRAYYEQPWFWGGLIFLALICVLGVALIFFRRKTRALEQKQRETKRLVNEISGVFADCVDMKDPYTNGHSKRVAKYTAMLAEKLGRSKEECEDIYNIAMLHDIGKISIPDRILNKPERLTDEEFEIMKSHSARGYEILSKIDVAPELALGAGYHHERLDGKGYPRGAKGDEIPEVAQIIAVADTFDAMYSTRPYRKKLPLSTVAGEIQRASGTQLSPRVVDAFMELVNEGAFNNE